MLCTGTLLIPDILINPKPCVQMTVSLYTTFTTAPPGEPAKASDMFLLDSSRNGCSFDSNSVALAIG